MDKCLDGGDRGLLAEKVNTEETSVEKNKIFMILRRPYRDAHYIGEAHTENV